MDINSEILKRFSNTFGTLNNDYEIRGEITAIFLNKNDGTRLETLINTSDLDIVKSFPGKITSFLNRSGTYYASGSVRNKTLYLHRWILNCPKGLCVDHINHDTLNNTRSNLRIVTAAQNNQNHLGAQKRSKSGVLGVHWDKEKSKWKVQVGLNGKNHHIGYYKDIKEAEIASIEARKKHLPFSYC